MRLLLRFLPVLFFIACGSDNNDALPDEPVLAAPSSLDLRDVANAGNAADFECSFTKPSDLSLIEEFRIFVVKSENRTSFDSLAAIQISSNKIV